MKAGTEPKHQMHRNKAKLSLKHESNGKKRKANHVNDSVKAGPDAWVKDHMYTDGNVKRDKDMDDATRLNVDVDMESPSSPAGQRGAQKPGEGDPEEESKEESEEDLGGEWLRTRRIADGDLMVTIYTLLLSTI